MSYQSSPGVPAGRATAVRKTNRLIAVVGVVGLLVALLVVPIPIGPPATLHVWGKQFNSTGHPTCDALSGPLCFDDVFGTVGPSPAAPITAEAMRQEMAERGMLPVVLHLRPGVLGWLFGMTDAGPKPSEHTEPIYLQVGPDAFIPYEWARCCMPDW